MQFEIEPYYISAQCLARANVLPTSSSRHTGHHSIMIMDDDFDDMEVATAEEEAAVAAAAPQDRGNKGVVVDVGPVDVAAQPQPRPLLRPPARRRSMTPRSHASH